MSTYDDAFDGLEELGERIGLGELVEGERGLGVEELAERQDWENVKPEVILEDFELRELPVPGLPGAEMRNFFELMIQLNQGKITPQAIQMWAQFPEQQAVGQLTPQPENAMMMLMRGEITRWGEIRMLWRKNLTPTDLNMLVICQLAAVVNFLNPQEIADINGEQLPNGRCPNVEVELLDPSLRQWSCHLSSLSKGRNRKRNCVLRKNWNAIVRECHLKEHTSVELWTFRVDGRLWIGLWRW